MTETMGLMEGTIYMEGMGLKFTSVIVRRHLGLLSMFVPMAGTSGTLG